MGEDRDTRKQQDIAAAVEHEEVGDKVVTLLSDDRSIFDLWSIRQRYTVLLVAAFATLLLPFCDTIYLPALRVVQSDLKTTEAWTTATVSIYMFCVGIVCLVWGPLSDAFGRRITYIVACVAFIAVSIVCIFAPNIAVLAAFRALQGASVGAFWAIGNGSISDVFPPESRGTAAGIFMVPVLVGPILGPLVGGGLSQAFGWRSTFVCLAGLAGVALAGILFLLPETHQYMILERLRKRDPDMASVIDQTSVVEKPAFMAPWGPLVLLCTADIAPYAAVALVFFGSMFMTYIELPLFIAKSPYNLSEGIIGVCYLAAGIGSFMGSIVGGILSDIFYSKFKVIEARLLPGTVISLVTGIPGFLLFGLALEKTMPLAVILVAHFLAGFSPAVFLPCVFSFLTLKKQSQASAAAAGLQSLMFIISGALISVAVEAVDAIGAGTVFSIAGGVCGLVAVIALILELQAVRRGLKDAEGPVESDKPSSAT